MRLYFIVNPVAGDGKALNRFSEASDILRDKGFEIASVLTERERHAAELANKAYADGERSIIAVGGDGTVNEVASALYDKPGVVMGVLPFGTGNDFAKAINMPCSPAEAAKVIAEGNTQLIDMGLANSTPFINVGGIGFDVDVLINTEKYKGRFGGMAPYLLGIFKTLLHIKRIPVTVTANGESETLRMLLCAVGNGTHFGGGMAVTPKADPADGKFDVCLVRETGLLRLLTLLPGFIKGKHLNKKPVRYFRADEVTIDCERLPLQLDGEVGTEHSPVTFKLAPGALRMIVPENRG